MCVCVHVLCVCVHISIAHTPLTLQLLYSVITEMSFSYWIALTSQTTHVSSEVEWPKPDENNVVHMDW